MGEGGATVTEFEEERFRGLAALVMAGGCSAEERAEVERGLLGGGRAAEIFAEEARASVVIEAFFRDERKRSALAEELQESAGSGVRWWRWGAAAAALVALFVALYDFSDRGTAGPPLRHAEVGASQRVLEAEVPEREAQVGTGPGDEVLPADGSPAIVADGPEETRRVLSRFFLPEVDLEDVPLGEALAFLSQALKAYNVAGRESLESLVLGAGRGIEDRRITLKTRGVPFLTALRSLAAQVGGEVVIDPPAVALVRREDGREPDGEMITRMFAGMGEMVEGDKEAVDALMASWGIAQSEGSSATKIGGNFLVRTSGTGMDATEVMLDELKRRRDEPLTLEVMKIVVEGDGAIDLTERVEDRAGVERLTRELGVGQGGAEAEVEVAPWPDQEPIVVGEDGGDVGGGRGERGADPAGGEDAGDAETSLVMLAGVDDAPTLIPMRIGERFGVVTDSALGAGGESLFLSHGSMLVFGATDTATGGGGQSLILIGVSEGGGTDESNGEGAEP